MQPGEIAQIAGMFANSTEPHPSNEQLRASEERFRAVWESAGDAMALSDPDGTVLAANPAYLELYGYTAEEVVGRNFAIIFPPELREWANEQYRQTFADPVIAPSVDATIQRRDGSIRVVDARYTFLTRDGERTAMISIVRDITERKRAEDERNRLLERERQAHARAMQAVLMRDQVLSTVAHDLRNPLTSIKGYAQLLKNRIQREAEGMQLATDEGASEAGQSQHVLAGLTRIDETVNRMNGLIDELLDTVMLQIGQPLDLQRAPVDLVTLTCEAVGAWRQTTDRHTLDFHAAVPDLVGHWDSPRLRRVVDNVLGNAIKYSPQGGVVEVSVYPDDESPGSRWAVLEVRDHGIGIPAGDRPRIFDWFYRAKNSPEDIAGSGIGLAGAHDIVQQHGGTITIDSEEGVGTCFIIRLPL